jgi:hypothetical protein
MNLFFALKYRLYIFHMNGLLLLRLVSNTRMHVRMCVAYKFYPIDIKSWNREWRPKRDLKYILLELSFSSFELGIDLVALCCENGFLASTHTKD